MARAYTFYENCDRRFEGSDGARVIVQRDLDFGVEPLAVCQALFDRLAIRDVGGRFLHDGLDLSDGRELATMKEPESDHRHDDGEAYADDLDLELVYPRFAIRSGGSVRCHRLGSLSGQTMIGHG